MENVGIFNGHLEYFLAIYVVCILFVWPFGVVCGPLVYFSRFGMFGPRKIWQPWFVPMQMYCSSTKQVSTLHYSAWAPYLSTHF
jgi:hypothetical protein